MHIESLEDLEEEKQRSIIKEHGKYFNDPVRALNHRKFFESYIEPIGSGHGKAKTFETMRPSKKKRLIDIYQILALRLK